MEAADRLPFFELLDATCEAISMRQPMTAGAKVLLWEDLERYPFELVRAALAAHRQDKDRGQWQPNTAHIEYQIDRRRRNKWITADEAYVKLPQPTGPVIAYRSDESAYIDYSSCEPPPCLLNQVTAQAWAIALPFLTIRKPDHNAARMAFRACYDRLIEQEKLAHRAPNWWVSPGGSLEEQDALHQEAARLGYLDVNGMPFQLRTPPSQLILGTSPQPGRLKALLSTLNNKALPSPGAES